MESFEVNKDELKGIIQEFEFDEVIETGTHVGTGSTKIFALTDKPVFSIESSTQFYNQAIENLKLYENVTAINGYSLKWDDLFEYIFQYDDPDETENVDSKYHRNFYLREVLGFGNGSPKLLPDNLLPKMISNDRKQLIFLDSAGGVGYLEFLTVISLIPTPKTSNKILLLDDCTHIKHRQSVQYLKDHKYEVHESPSKRMAWVKL